MSIIWLAKLILSHLVTDFVLQPKSWIEDRQKKHFASSRLYLHATITAIIALLLIGFNYWLYAIVIFVTHTIIDGWKSYRPEIIRYFLIDQLLHLLVILACWYYIFYTPQDLELLWKNIGEND